MFWYVDRFAFLLLLVPSRVCKKRNKSLTHLRPRYVSSFDYQLRFGTKEGRVPQHQIGHLTSLTDEERNTVTEQNLLGVCTALKP